MQVFTTIYLAETLRANVRNVEETPGLDLTLPAVREFSEVLLRSIAELERRYTRAKENMSVQPRKPLLESLRHVLSKMEADPAPETANLADLKRIVRERIASIEAADRIVLPAPQPAHSPKEP